ncbi:flagellar FlbD family protein [Enterobacter asburiae]|uniref:flagellar FlbD family protein n=1 Tax=Enterobacter asburiae TaxID=61645 RepID=UPI00292903E8|nr:flagellar FlbD family protein [Enterobacter asburiae]
MIIELTNNAGHPVFLNRDHIISFKSNGHYTEIVLTNGQTVTVKDKPSIITDHLNKWPG